MMNVTTYAVYELFSEMLDYPSYALNGMLQEGISLMKAMHPCAADVLEECASMFHEMSPSTREELYTATFDLQPLCSPYIGSHLFGDDALRGIFMVHLKECYHRYDIAFGSELPDHISLVLRLIARDEDEIERAELVEECMIPALTAMVDAFGEQPNPYKHILYALLMVLRESEPGGIARS